mmetsp:Transcript_7756/g.22031  ORF Transcript_7756/g.22031 Transcript_7756/m.22031 type:complete len:222 (-) Transcript_7756:2582-3247(-)
MVTSQGSKPAACRAAAISRSPLLPSSLSTATRTLSSRARISGSVASGVNDSRHSGAVRSARPLSSCATHPSAHCRRSSRKAVSSHAARSSCTELEICRAPPAATSTCCAARVRPRRTQGTPASSRNKVCTRATSFSATSSTRPSSSANMAAITSPEGSGRSTSTPQLPAKAISRTAVASPPSLTSWPALMTRASISCCVASKALLKAPTLSMSGETSPSWP